MRDGLEELIEFVREEILLRHMVEVGSCRGESAEMFAKEAGLVYAVDPWQDYDSFDVRVIGMDKVEESFDQRLAKLIAERRVIKIKDTSVRAAEDFSDRCLDLVYLDGDHAGESVRKDILAWIPKVRHGGFIGGHDYRHSEIGKYDGLIEVVDELCGPDIRRFEDSSWIVLADECPCRFTEEEKCQT
jgi:hypothetical protein